MSLHDKRLILVLGKGGVGRSTVAAAIASSLAKQGRRTLLYECNANDRFASFFDSEAVSSKIAPLRENLFAVNTNAEMALEEYGLMVLKWRSVYKMVFENKVTKYFLRAIPGLDDYSILGKAWFHTTERSGDSHTWDTLVFDMPASGHSLTMLQIPKAIQETVPDGPLTRDAGEVEALISDPARTAIVLVTLAEEMPSNEARDLTSKLQELGLEVSHLVINQIYPDRFPEGSPAGAVLDRLSSASSLSDDLAALVSHSELALLRRRLNDHYLSVLESWFDGDVHRLPLLFVPALGSREIESLAENF